MGEPIRGGMMRDLRISDLWGSSGEEKYEEMDCQTSLGTLGRDFSPRPLFCYSFLRIDCQIEILAGGEGKADRQEIEVHQEQKCL